MQLQPGLFGSSWLLSSNCTWAAAKLRRWRWLPCRSAAAVGCRAASRAGQRTPGRRLPWHAAGSSTPASHSPAHPSHKFTSFCNCCCHCCHCCCHVSLVAGAGAPVLRAACASLLHLQGHEAQQDAGGVGATGAAGEGPAGTPGGAGAPAAAAAGLAEGGEHACWGWGSGRCNLGVGLEALSTPEKASPCASTVCQRVPDKSARKCLCICLIGPRGAAIVPSFESCCCCSLPSLLLLRSCRPGSRVWISP